MLDALEGIDELDPIDGDEYPLPAWYRRVWEIPLERFELEDICRACRQGIHLAYVVPFAVELLQKDALAGEMYDGELLNSLLSVPTEYWAQWSDEAVIVREIAESVTHSDETDDEIRATANELMRRLAPPPIDSSGESRTP
jgi:hypothetical protein